MISSLNRERLWWRLGGPGWGGGRGLEERKKEGEDPDAEPDCVGTFRPLAREAEEQEGWGPSGAERDVWPERRREPREPWESVNSGHWRRSVKSLLNIDLGVV